MEKYRNTEMIRARLGEVLRGLTEQAQTKLPEQGRFQSFWRGCELPDLPYSTYLMVLVGIEPNNRAIQFGVYRTGNDRAVTVFQHFENSEELRQWLTAESSVDEYMKTVFQLIPSGGGLD